MRKKMRVTTALPWVALILALGAVWLFQPLIHSRARSHSLEPAPSVPPVSSKPPGPVRPEVPRGQTWCTPPTLGAFPDPDTGQPARTSRLTSDQNVRLKTLLAAAEGATSRDLVSDIQAARVRGGGHELHLRALLLVWALERRPSRLDEIASMLAASGTGDDLRRTLLVIVGQVGSGESRQFLLRRLDDPYCASIVPDVLQALHQPSFGSVEVIADQYSQLIDDRVTNWPKDYQPFGDPSTDPEVVRATLARGGASYPAPTRRMAALLLSGLATPMNVASHAE